MAGFKSGWLLVSSDLPITHKKREVLTGTRGPHPQPCHTILHPDPPPQTPGPSPEQVVVRQPMAVLQVLPPLRARARSRNAGVTCMLGEGKLFCL